MIIAVDFDGTIVEHRYPRIGEEIPFAVDTLKLLQQEKHRLILWSVREGALLDEAVEWCKARGLEFYAVNKDYPEEQKGHQGFSRKLKAAIYLFIRKAAIFFSFLMAFFPLLRFGHRHLQTSFSL